MISAVNVARGVRTSVLLLVVASLAACGGDSATESNPGPYSVGGSVTGLESGDTLTLSNNGGNFLILRTDTAFAFSRRIASGGAFQVAVTENPLNKVCSVSSGTGTASSDVSSVNISCGTPSTYAIGGTVTGLSGALILRNNGGDDVKLTSAGVYSFPTRLVSGSAYQVVIHDELSNQDCTISNATGTVGGGNVVNVNVSCGAIDSWSHPANLAAKFVAPAMAQNQINPQIAMDGNGNAIAVWQQSDGANTQIYMSDYNLTAPNAWTHPTGLADNISPDGADAFNPQVAMGRNPAGLGSDDAVIVWAQKDTTSPSTAKTQIFMSERRLGGWTHPASLTANINPEATGAFAFEDPTVAMDDNGNSLIVWRQLDGPTLGANFPLLYVSEYRAGWTHPANEAASFSQAANEVRHSPDVAMGNNGEAIVVWRQYGGGGGNAFRVYRREYRAASWSAVQNVSTDSITPRISGGYTGPKVAMDNSGNAIIVWEQTVEEAQPHPYFPSTDPADDPVEISQIFKSEYRGSAWADPANQFDNISPAGLNAVNPKVAMDDNGQAIITWLQSDSRDSQLFKSEYRLNAWTNPTSLADNFTPSGGSVANNELAMDNSNNAIITWRQFDGFRSQVYKSEYRSSVWRHPVSLLDSISPGTSASVSSTPAVAMDNTGDALILWSQSDAEIAPINQQIYMSELR